MIDETLAEEQGGRAGLLKKMKMKAGGPVVCIGDWRGRAGMGELLLG